MVKAELAIDPIMSRRDPRRTLKPFDGESHGRQFGAHGWGGVIVSTASLGFTPFEPANLVYADWVVPSIFPVTGEPRTVGFWVGLDGQDPTSVELLQAGTAATVTGNEVTCWAWTEWFTSEYRTPSVRVENFAIQPGDRVSVLVCTAEPDQGFVSMMNYRTQEATSVGIPAPGSDITSVGARAIWAVEVPEQSGVTGQLPDFSPLVFDSATAGTRSHGFDLLPMGMKTNIGGIGDLALTETFIMAGDIALVRPATFSKIKR
jgi:hypothetical protein